MPHFAAYAASKAFVLSFSEALAEELRGTGVIVTAVALGFVSTEFTEVAGSGEPERRLTHLQPRRVVESGLRAHARGRTVTVVGPFYEFLTFAGRFAPRALLRRMMGRQLRPAHNTQHPRQMLRHHEARRQRRRPSTPVMAVHSASSPVFCQPWSNRLVSLGPFAARGA